MNERSCNMNRVSRHLVVAGLLAMLLVPLPAGAETLLTPWLGVNTGTRTGSSGIDFGTGVGTTIAGVIGADFDFGYSPDFFGSNLNSYVLTTMGNVTVGIPFGGTRAPGLRPYLTGGIGLIRAHLKSPLYGYSVTNNDVGVNVGGGLMGFFGDHFGVRADLRYIRSLDDDNSTSPFGPINLGHLHYWRTSFGVVLR